VAANEIKTERLKRQWKACVFVPEGRETGENEQVMQMARSWRSLRGGIENAKVGKEDVFKGSTDRLWSGRVERGNP
jgi:hypothetical protein